VEEFGRGLEHEGEDCEIDDEHQHHGLEHAFGGHDVAEVHLAHHHQHGAGQHNVGFEEADRLRADLGHTQTVFH